MNDEPNPDPILSLLPAPTCEMCSQPIAGEIHFTGDDRRVDSACYAKYVKEKYGGDNPNPDNYRVL